MNPTVRQREISQGKVVQIGNYPRDRSQDNPLAGIAQIRLQLLTKDGHQSALGKSVSRKNKLERLFLCPKLLVYIKRKKHAKKAYIFAYLWCFYSK